jgi:fumarylacetoacetase
VYGGTTEFLSFLPTEGSLVQEPDHIHRVVSRQRINPYFYPYLRSGSKRLCAPASDQNTPYLLSFLTVGIRQRPSKLGKSFRTSVSPWIITAEALEPFRIPQPPRPEGDPEPLPHLLSSADQTHGALDIECEVYLSTPVMRAAGLAPDRLCRSNTRELYWTVGQMVAHHASNGCNLRPGDLLGSGTISGTERASIGCLLEMTFGGRDAITLSNGETRHFLQDGDEISLHAHCRRSNAVTIGFGECRGRIVAA